MDADAFDQLFDNFSTEALRLETLPEYLFGADVREYERYLDGAALPSWTERPWITFLEEQQTAGRSVTLIRVEPSRPTPYWRFAIDWGYVYSAAAGQDIRVLTTDAPSHADAVRMGDIWAFDLKQCVRMIYGEDGVFQDHELIPPQDTEAVLHQIERFRVEATPLDRYLSKLRTAPTA